MTDYENVLVETEASGVATITLNRPEKLNALSVGLRNDLEAALRELNPGDAVRVIRLKAAGRAFCAGYDLTPNPGRRAAPTAAAGTHAWELGESRVAVDRESLRESVNRWLWMWAYRKPIVAQVNGFCLAGGLELAPENRSALQYQSQFVVRAAFVRGGIEPYHPSSSPRRGKRPDLLVENGTIRYGIEA